MGLVAFTGVLMAGSLFLLARVPSVWAGAGTPLDGIPGIWFGRSRRTYLMYALAMNAFFDGMFLVFTGMRFNVDAVWQVGTVLMVVGTPIAVLAWIVVAVFNRPRFVVPPDQREHRTD